MIKYESSHVNENSVLGLSFNEDVSNKNLKSNCGEAHSESLVSDIKLHCLLNQLLSIKLGWSHLKGCAPANSIVKGRGKAHKL